MNSNAMSRRKFFYMSGLGSAAFLAACGSNGSDKSGTSATGSNSPSGSASGGTVKEITVPGFDEPWLPAYRKVAAAFEKKTGVKVKMPSYPYSALKTQQTNDIQNQTQTFDVFLLDEAWIAQFYSSGYATPLKDIDPSYKLDEQINQFDGLPYWDNKKNVNSADGTLYGVPLSGNATLFVYRKDVYEDLGLEVPKTWEDALRNGQKGKDSGAIEYGYAVRTQPGSIHDFSNTFYSYGANWFKEPGVDWTPEVTTQQSIDALTMYNKLGALGPNPSTVSQANIASMLAGGKLMQGHLVATLGTQLVDPSQSPQATNLAFHVVPAGPIGHPTPVSGTWSLCVPAAIDDDRKAVALEFIHFATSKEGQEILLDNGNGGVAVRSDVLSSANLVDSASKWMPVYAKSLENIHSLTRFSFGAKFVNQANVDINNVLNGKVGVEDGLSALSDHMTEIVKDAGLLG